MVGTCAQGPEYLVSIPYQALSTGLTVRSQWPHLYNGSRKESVKRKSTWSSWVLDDRAGSAVLALWPRHRDATYPALVSCSNVRAIALPPLERAEVEVPGALAGARVGGGRSQNLLGQRHSLGGCHDGCTAARGGGKGMWL